MPDLGLTQHGKMLPPGIASSVEHGSSHTPSAYYYVARTLDTCTYVFSQIEQRESLSYQLVCQRCHAGVCTAEVCAHRRQHDPVFDLEASSCLEAHLCSHFGIAHRTIYLRRCCYPGLLVAFPAQTLAHLLQPLIQLIIQHSHLNRLGVGGSVLISFQRLSIAALQTVS